jgi:hypothetical protein
LKEAFEELSSEPEKVVEFYVMIYRDFEALEEVEGSRYKVVFLVHWVDSNSNRKLKRS